MFPRLHFHVRWIVHRDLTKIESHSPISFDHHFEREAEIDTFFPRLPSILSFIGVTGNSEDLMRQINVILQTQFTVILRGIGEELRQNCSPLWRDQFGLFYCPSASAFDRRDGDSLARRWTEWMNWIHCSWESVGRNSLSPHCSSSFDSKWRSILRTFVEEIDRLDLFIGHMIKGKGKETSAISTVGQRIQVKRQRRRNISGRECDDLFSPLCFCERTHEGVFRISQERRYRLIAQWIPSSFCVKLKDRRAGTCNEGVTLMLRHSFIEDNGNLTDGETNQASPVFLSLSLSRSHVNSSLLCQSITRCLWSMLDSRTSVMMSERSEYVDRHMTEVFDLVFWRVEEHE